jgi:hypothetical protein
MFGHKHYVPILKSKEGEFKALAELKVPSKDFITPLFEIVGVPWDYTEEEEMKTIEDHLDKIAGKIITHWGNKYSYFVDGWLIDENRKMSDSVTHYFDYFFQQLRINPILGIPVTGMSRHIDYKTAVKKIISIDKKGVCVRIEAGDISNPQLNSLMDNEIKYYGVQPKDIDIIIDLDEIQQTPIHLITISIITFINSLIHLKEWRTLTISSSAFPIDLSGITVNTVDTIDRNDWSLWKHLLIQPLKRKPSFGDYGISNPEIIDIDPRQLTMSASIRYTCHDFWLILRGRSIKKYRFGQYFNLCSTLVGRPEYSGNSFSWGDQYIEDCSNRIEGPGNATTWRKVANNHHFEMVVNQLSSPTLP